MFFILCPKGIRKQSKVRMQNNRFSYIFCWRTAYCPATTYWYTHASLVAGYSVKSFAAPIVETHQQYVRALINVIWITWKGMFESVVRWVELTHSTINHYFTKGPIWEHLWQNICDKFLTLSQSVNLERDVIQCLKNVLQMKIYLTNAARTLLSWSRVVSETCPTWVSNTHIVCIFKNLSCVHVSCSFQHCHSVQHSI